MQNAQVTAFATLLLNCYILGRGKGRFRKTGNEEQRCTSLCTATMHIELYVCILLLVTLKLYMLT